MEEKKRCITKLRKTMTLREFEAFARKVIKEYANSENHFSASYFAEEYNLTMDCFYKLRDEAIIRNLVSEKEVDKMEAKAIENQKANNKSAGSSTKQKFSRLRIKRDEYMFELYSAPEIEDLAIKFAEHPEMTKEEIAEQEDISVHLLLMILKKAFVYSYADDEVCKAIETRSLAKNSSKKAKDAFEKLWNMRKEKALK